MNLKLNHIAVMADNSSEVSKFYRDVLDFEPIYTPGAASVDLDTYKWLKMDGGELHIVGRDPNLAKDLGVSIDPMHAHFAIECESAEQIRKITERLTAAGVKWMDWSPHGIPGKHQVFMIDPGGNLVEFQLGPNAP